ncbi:Type IV pilus biogenesis factor PilY1 [BD1-7 clade bacterium]|uniref:Type IV pilus biogenesis factor PilY1 n=1 Tax=BD1-7 clade bacterium TaxID=2029982 RepID=A0A5S9PUP4_9GAMM|nr:Type IV pilus biogenesis factor PilY1 [BD1-7 clade bacterium]
MMIRTLLLCLFSVQLSWADSLDISQMPLGLQNTIAPNLTIMMDSSGSMANNTLERCKSVETQAGGTAFCKKRCRNWSTDTSCPDNDYSTSYSSFQVAEGTYDLVVEQSDGWVVSYRDPWSSWRLQYKQCVLSDLTTEIETVCESVTRQKAAIDVATDLTNDLDGFYVSLFNFTTSSGGRLVQPPLLMDSEDTANYGNNIEQLKSVIASTPGNTWTPLGETLSGIARYYALGVPANLWITPTNSLGTKSAPREVALNDVFLDSLLSLNGYSSPTYSPNGADIEQKNKNMTIKGWCQKNYLITLTDGAPSRDQNVDADLEDYEKDTYTCNDNGNPSGPEVDCRINHVSGALWDVDLRPDLCDPALLKDLEDDYNVVLNHCSDMYRVKPVGSNETVYQLLEKEKKVSRGADDSLVNNDDRLHRYKNNIRHYVVGFAGSDVTASVLMEDTAKSGAGDYYGAADSEALGDVFDTILSTIQSGSNASSGIGISLTRGSSSDYIYRASYNTSDWSGRLQKIKLKRRQGILDLSDVVWDTDEDSIPVETPVPDSEVSAEDRHIFTWDPNSGKGISLEWSLLTSEHPIRQDLEQAVEGGSTLAEDRLDYLRGDQNKEFKYAGDVDNAFRDRKVLLGDLVSSTPKFVPADDVVGNGANLWSESLLEFGAVGSSYKSFYSSNPRNKSLVYVNSNDGMLHAFNDETGKEVFAYLPSFAASNEVDRGLRFYSQINYEHRFSNDGSVEVYDAWLKSAQGGADWRTLLVSGGGAGNRGIYLLDITYDNSSYFEQSGANAERLVVWEFTHPEMGYTFTKPYIGPMTNGRWAVVTNNGYNSASGEAALFIIYLDADLSDGWTEGSDFVIIKTGVGSSADSNGLSPIIALDLYRDTVTEDGLPIFFSGETVTTDTDGDGEAETKNTFGTIDRVYAGDTNGNMWAFDLRSTDPKDWEVDHDGSPLFRAEGTRLNGGSSAQVITAPPTVMFLGDYIQDCERLLTGSTRDARGVLVGAPFGETGVEAFEDEDFFPSGGFNLAQRHLNCGPNILVLFGTGKFVSADDVEDISKGSFYAVWDNMNTDNYPLTRDNLDERVFSVSGSRGSLVRSISDVDGNEKSKGDFPQTGWNIEDEFGWYVDLTEEGEKQVSSPLVALITGEVFFTTLIPDKVACSFGGTSFFNSISALTGVRSTNARSATINASVQLEGILGEPQIGSSESPGSPSFVLLGGNNVVGVKAVDAQSRKTGPISWTEIKSE